MFMLSSQKSSRCKSQNKCNKCSNVIVNVYANDTLYKKCIIANDTFCKKCIIINKILQQYNDNAKTN